MLHSLSRTKTSGINPSCNMLAIFELMADDWMRTPYHEFLQCRPRSLFACPSCLLRLLTGQAGRIVILPFVSAIQHVSICRQYLLRHPNASSSPPSREYRSYQSITIPSKPATPSTPSASTPAPSSHPSPPYAPETHLSSSSSRIRGNCTPRIGWPGGAASGIVIALQTR